MRELNNIILGALWDSNGYKTFKEVKETLINEVFKNVGENFDRKIEHFRVTINNLPKVEQDLFEEALKEYLEG